MSKPAAAKVTKLVNFGHARRPRFPFFLLQSRDTISRINFRIWFLQKVYDGEVIPHLTLSVMKWFRLYEHISSQSSWYGVLVIYIYSTKFLVKADLAAQWTLNDLLGPYSARKRDSDTCETLILTELFLLRVNLNLYKS
jgi:hypothetical protein